MVATCHEAVVRDHEEQPCDAFAVAMRYDPEEGNPYPVCSRHVRASMVPLENLQEGHSHRQVVSKAVAAFIPTRSNGRLLRWTICTRMHDCLYPVDSPDGWNVGVDEAARIVALPDIPF